jgi:hypothetical protein
METKTFISAYVNNDAFISERKGNAFFYLIETDAVGNKKIIVCLDANGKSIKISCPKIPNNICIKNSFIQWNLGFQKFIDLFN